MQKLKAIFYHYNYYLLPEGMSVEDLNGQVELRQLCTGNGDLGSIPPYFIDSLIKTTTVQMDDSKRIIACNVFVCDKAEYDEKLRALVSTKCVGCDAYGNDPNDLQGHYVEMDLDGLCCLRDEPNSKIIFYDILYYVIGAKLSAQFSAIKKCIDKGNDKKLSKLFNKHLNKIMFPLELCGRVEDGNYIIYARACASAPEFALDLKMVAEVFNNTPNLFAKSGWKFVPTLKAGVVKYNGKTKLNADSKVAYFTECGENNQSELRVFIPNNLRSNERKTYAYVQDVENYITSVLGEELYHLWFNIRMIDSDVALTTLDEVVNAIAECGVKHPAPFPKPIPIDLTDSQNMSVTPLFNREKLLHIGTTAPNIATLTQEDLQTQSQQTLWLEHYTFGYIYIPQLGDPRQLIDDLFWYLDYRNNVNDIRNPSFMSFVCGQGFCVDGGFMIDILFPNKNKALDRLRGILPVLHKYNAQISLVDESCKLDTYLCGDTLQKIY